MPWPRGKLVYGGAIFVTAILVGCGGSEGGEKIPSDDAQAMLETVSAIGTATASEECDVAQASTTKLRQQVDALPDDVDPEIEDALTQMVSRVDEQLDSECVETGTSEPEEETTPVEPVEPVDPVEPVEPTSVPEETEPEEEPTPEQPPDEGGGPQGPPSTPPGQSGGGPPGTGGVEEEG